MTEATPRSLAIGITAFVAITGAVVYGLVQVNKDPTDCPSTFTVDWPALPDGGRSPSGPAVCVRTTALLTGDAGTMVLGAYGACVKAPQYLYARVCGLLLPDGGPSDEDPLPELLPGVEAMQYEQTEEIWDGGPQLVAVLQGAPGWPCACSTGTGCEWLAPQFEAPPEWQTAPKGRTFGPDQWRGAGCFPKSCAELAGVAAFPTECE